MMTRILALMLAGVAVMFSTATVAEQTLPKVGILVPAYFDPGSDSTDWNRMAIAATQVPLIAIMNPSSGPGKIQNAHYTAAILSLRATGGRTVGYVHTSYGRRVLADVEKEVKTYFSWYPINGIFIDEMASSATPKNLNYYTALAAYIRKIHPGAVIVANPGVGFASSFASAKVADVFIDAEDMQANVNAMPQATWEFGYPAKMFAEVAVQVNNDGPEIAFLSKRHLGWVYSTRLALNPNPYASLPLDFEREVAALVRVNAGR